MTPRVRGLLYIALSTLCFGFMSLAAKIAVCPSLPGASPSIGRLASVPVTPAETLFYRSLLGWLGLLAVARLVRARGTGEHPPLLILRGILGGLAVLSFFYAFAHTDLSKASLIGYAYPVFAILFARVFFRERVTPSAVLLMLVALAGVALILWPRGGTVSAAFSTFNTGDVAAVLASIFSGAAIATLRRLRRDEATITVVLHFTFWCTIVSLPALAISTAAGAPPTVPDIPHAILLGTIAVVAAVGQVFLTMGYKDCDTAEGGTMSLLNAVFAVAFAVLVLGETLAWTTWVGGVMTLGACLFLIAPHRGGAHGPTPTGDARPGS
jgi:drug/metabolite transporter (DMT)-like permease